MDTGVHRVLDPEHVEEIAGIKRDRRYNHDATKGVNGRNSDNTVMQQRLGWEPGIRLREGMERTYRWIYAQYVATHEPVIAP